LNQSIVLPEDFPAKTSAKPGNESESRALARVFGLSSPALLGGLDPDTYLLRTSQACLFQEQCPEWSESWPDSGMWDAGSVYELQTSAPVICESESSSSQWQTPATDSFRSRGGDRKDEMGLDQQARSMFPSPASRDYRTPNKRSFADRGGGSKGEQLQNFVEHSIWPTPRQEPGTHSMVNGKRYETSLEYVSRDSLPVQQMNDGPQSLPNAQTSRRRLNPRFVEWLMGFPIGHTELCKTEPSDSADLGTPSFQIAPNGSEDAS